MFDRKFFEENLPRLISEKLEHSPSVTVKLRLASGEIRSIVRSLSAGGGWVALEVYPMDGTPRRHDGDERALGAPQYDDERR